MRSLHTTTEYPPLAATRESPRAATKTKRSQKKKKKKNLPILQDPAQAFLDPSCILWRECPLLCAPSVPVNTSIVVLVTPLFLWLFTPLFLWLFTCLTLLPAVDSFGARPYIFSALYVQCRCSINVFF